jgi:iron(III) transport system substrate-binding protein
MIRRPGKLIFCFVALVVGALGLSCARSPVTVVVYSSEDQPCAEPILKDFEQDTHIHVVAVYDKEAAEHVMKRLIDEKNNPQADVYWANEPIHPDQLKALGITQSYVSPNASVLPAMFKDEDGHWTAFSARARVLVINSKSQAKPDSILAYADERWKGQAVLANPLLNTTAFNLTALFDCWGDKRAWEFLNKVKSLGVKTSPGNADSAVVVASGQAAFSLVDIDDGLEAVRRNDSVEIRYPDQGTEGLGTFMVANAVALIRRAHHPDSARKLIDYLLTAETQRKLAFSACAQTPLSQGVEVPSTVKRIDQLRVMQVNYSGIRKRLEELRPQLKAWLAQ